MSKNLPFFKFNIQSWVMGRIQKRSKDARIAFIDLCCMYWHTRGSITMEDSKYNFGEDEINELLKYKIIKSQEEKVVIEFLDEQLDEIRVFADKQSLKGKASAEARRIKSVVTDKENSTTVQMAETVVDEIPTYKKEEKKGDKKEEKTGDANPDQFGKQSIRETLLNDLPNSTYIKTIADLNQITKEKVISLIPAFRKAADLEYPTAAKFYNHFKNWVPKQLTPASEAPAKASYTPKR